eukprot:IDg16575t1
MFADLAELYLLIEMDCQWRRLPKPGSSTHIVMPAYNIHSNKCTCRVCSRLSVDPELESYFSYGNACQGTVSRAL